MTAGRSIRTFLAASTAGVVLLTLAGGYLAPAAAAPVLAADTLRSGAGVAFGRNDLGQTNPSSAATTQLGAVALPSGAGGALADAVSIGAGNGFAVWADHLGVVWSIGDNASGTSGNGSTGGVLPAPVRASGFGGPGQPKAVKVSAYGSAVDVLDDSGRVWQWGQVVNSASTLAIQSSPNLVPFPSGAARIVDVSAGATHSLALDAAGKAYAWGRNDRGQLGLGTTSTSPYPAALPTGTTTGKLPVVPAGGQAFLEAGRDGGTYALSYPSGSAFVVDVWTWGRNDLYQLGNGKAVDSRSPVKVGSWTGPTLKVLALSGGGTHTLLLTNDGVIRSWGTSGVATYKTPTAVADPLGAVSGSHHPYTVAAGDNASFAASTDGTVAAWGTDTTGQLGRQVTGTLASPTVVGVPGTLPPSPSGVPAEITSRQGATYVLVDAQVLRTPDQLGYQFPSTPVAFAPGQSAPTHVVTLTNVANRPLAVTSVVLDGAHPGDFRITGTTCAGALAVDATCTVSTAFDPTATGLRQAGVIVRTSNTRGGLLLSTVVPLRGVGYASVPGVAGYALSLAAGTPTTVPGPGNVLGLDRLDPVLLTSDAGTVDAAGLGRIGLGRIGLGRIGLGRIDLGSAGLGRIGLGRIGLGRIDAESGGVSSLDSVGLGRIGLGRIGLGRIGLGRIGLGRIPLLAEGGWESFVTPYTDLRNRPISSLTLLDLSDQGPENGVAAPFDRLVLGDLRLDAALARVSALAVVWGGTRLGQLPGDLCAELPAVAPGNACTDGEGLNRTLVDLSLHHDVPIDALSLNDHTIGEVRTDALSTGTDPLADAVWPLFTLGKVRIAGTHFDLPLSALPDLDAVVDCSRTDCTSLAGRSLGDEDVLPAIRPEALIRDLGSALDPLRISWVLEPVLDASLFPWELLQREDIPLQAYPNRMTLQADVDVNCLQVSGTTFGFDLGPGFTYVPGTARLTKTRGTGTLKLADPTSDPARGLVVSVPDSSFAASGPIACADDSAHLTVSLGVLPTGTPTGSPYRASGDVRTGTLSASGTQAGPGVTVTGVSAPPNDSPTDPRTVLADRLVLGEVTRPGQTKYVPIDVAPDQVLEVTLSDLSGDLDMVLYHPEGAAADELLTADAPVAEVPFGESARGDESDLTPLGRAAGGALQDVPVLPGRQVAAVSAMRGLEVEQASTVTRAGSDNRYLLAVDGFNGAVGRFTVRFRTYRQQTLGPCTVAVPPVGAAPAAPFHAPSGQPPVAGLSPTDQTVVLVATSQLAAWHGAAAAQSVLDAAYRYTHQAGGVAGQVLQVDASPAVRSALAAWNAAPCDVSLSNRVVRAVNEYLASLVPSGSQLRSVVLVGDHRVLPHALRRDGTREGNEREEATDVALVGNSSLSAAFAASYYPTDDPYGTTRPLVAGGQVLYLPQRAIGRVGESPAAMVAQFDQFVSVAGVADPTATSDEALVTDYNFLTSGGDAVQGTLQRDGFEVTRLTSPTKADPQWTAAELRQQWLDGSKDLGALNMHYDHYRALPADQDAAGTQNDLYTAAQVREAAAPLNRRVVLTVGCHSALDLPDSYGAAGDPRTYDWPQAYADKGLAVMVGNLGYGYADSTVLAYSARLQANLTTALARHYDLGTSLVEAKRRYVSQLVSVSSYGVKSMQEMVLWGLPEYRLTQAPAERPGAGPAPQALTAPTGLTTHTVDVGTAATPVSFRTVDDGPTSHLEASHAGSGFDTAAVSGLPLLPLVTVDLPVVDGQAVRSALPVALTTTPGQAVDPTFARAGTDHALEPESLDEGDWPASLGHLWTTEGLEGARSSLLVTPAQVHLEGGAGTVQTVPASRWEVTYGAPGPVRADDITLVNAYRVGSGSSTTTTFDVAIKPAPGATTTTAYVLAEPAAGHGQWVRVDLEEVGQLPDGSRQFAGGRLGESGRYLVFSRNSYGFSASSSLKGLGYHPQLVPAPGPDFAHIAFDRQPDGANGWHLSAPTASCDEGWGLVVDGVQVPCPYTFTDGAHLVQVVRPDGTLGTGSVAVLVDTVVPVVTVAVPGLDPVTADGGLHHAGLNKAYAVTTSVVAGPSGFTVSDDSAGGQLRTATPGGPQVVTATVTNGAGVTSTDRWRYRVVYGTQSGFVAPVSTDATNTVLPLLPVRFSYRLFDGNGVAVGAGQEQGNTASFTTTTGCAALGAVQLPSALVPGAAPRYDASTGRYLWDLAADGLIGCQQLTIGLNDGWTRITALVHVGVL